MSSLVIGVGNRFRRDDGVGPAVLDALRGRVPEEGLVECDGEPARLLDAWSGQDHVVLVDAARTGAPPGTCRCLAVGPGTPLPSARPASTHAAGVGEAWALGQALDRLPGRLVVVAVEVGDLGDGPGLSAEVAAAVPVAAARVLEALEAPACA